MVNAAKVQALAECKVEAAQTKLWRVRELASNINQWLLEHHAGVLAMALAATKRTQADEEQDNAEGLLLTWECVLDRCV